MDFLVHLSFPTKKVWKVGIDLWNFWHIIKANVRSILKFDKFSQIQEYCCSLRQARHVLYFLQKIFLPLKRKQDSKTGQEGAVAICSLKVKPDISCTFSRKCFFPRDRMAKQDKRFVAICSLRADVLEDCCSLRKARHILYFFQKMFYCQRGGRMAKQDKRPVAICRLLEQTCLVHLCVSRGAQQMLFCQM